MFLGSFLEDSRTLTGYIILLKISIPSGVHNDCKWWNLLGCEGVFWHQGIDFKVVDRPCEKNLSLYSKFVVVILTVLEVS